MIIKQQFMRGGLYLALLFFLVSFMGCSLINIEGSAEPLPINELNARIMTHEFAGIILKTLDESADSIIVISHDHQIQMNALRWKINAVSTSRNAIFQADPILALVDTWTFMLQLDEFLKQGNGKNLFGQYQFIAQEATEQLVAKVDSITISVVKQKEYKMHRDFVDYYVTNNQLDDLSFKRNSVMAAWYNYTNTPDSIAVETVGSLPETVSDLTSRITHYGTEFPLQAQWNTDLILRENGLDSLQISAHLDSLSAMVDNLNELILNSPELVDSAMIHLTPVFYMIDRKWTLTLKILQKEREILLSALQSERLAVMADFDKISQNIAQILMDNIKSLINDILIYIIIILIILLGLPFTMGILVGRILESKKK